MSFEAERIAARLYDGTSSSARPVDFAVSPAEIRLDGAPFEPRRVRRIVEPIGAASWQFELTDGGLIEAAPAAGAALARAFGHRPTRIRRWERSLPLILLTIPLLALAGYGVARGVVPFLADRAALAMPASADRLAGRESLALFDRMTEPSRIGVRRQTALRRRFAAMAAVILGRNAAVRLEFRDSPEIGPNAFTLPGGTVIATDQLVTILDDDEIMAVLAHELGHVENRHVMRMIFRSSGLAVLAAAMFGDSSTLGGVLVGLPVMVMQLDFSRSFETQADDVAFRWLSRPGGDPCDFAEALLKIEAAVRQRDPDSRADAPPNWLSTHPGTPARINRFQKFCRPAPLVPI